MYRKITPDTETDSLLAIESAGRSAKPFLCELAQEVFRKENGEKRIDRRILHAFSQFKSQDLALIIDAKRDGVFDYGEFIVEVPGGYQYPKAADALKMLVECTARGKGAEHIVVEISSLVELPPEQELEEDQPEQDEALTSLEESMNQRILSRDVREEVLVAMKTRPLQQLHLEVTGNRTARGETKTEEGRLGIINRILAIEFSEDTPLDPQPTESTVVEAVITAPTIEVAVEAVEVHSKLEDTSVVDLAPHIEARKDEDMVAGTPEGFVYEKSVLAGLRGIFVLVDILRRNQDALASHLLEHGIQNRDWHKVPSDIIKDYDTLVASIEIESGEESEPQEESSPDGVEFREDDDDLQEDAEEVTTPDNGHSEEEIEEIFAKNYAGDFLTMDELRDLDTHDLQHYATQTGVKNANAQAFTPLLIRQVLKRLDSIKSIKESLGQSLS